MCLTNSKQCCTAPSGNIVHEQIFKDSMSSLDKIQCSGSITAFLVHSKEKWPNDNNLNKVKAAVKTFLSYHV